MAGWTTVDDFETGSLSGDWSGDDSIVVSSLNPLEGTYSVILDTDGADYVVNEDSIILHTKSVSRNSDGDKTIRCLIKNTRESIVGSYGTALVFLSTDLSNYYIFRVHTDKGDLDTTIYLEKVVSGTVTELASYNFNDSGATQVLGVEIKAETNLITAYTYTDSSFSTSTGTTISSSDTTYTSGEVGIAILSAYSPGQGVKEVYKADYIQWYDAVAGWANKIYGIVPGKVEGVAVANIGKVEGVS